MIWGLGEGFDGEIEVQLLNQWWFEDNWGSIGVSAVRILLIESSLCPAGFAISSCGLVEHNNW